MPDHRFWCPRCHHALEAWSERYECSRCTATYPIVAGIPDFRLYPDPYISLEADRAKGCHLADEATRLDFAGLVTHYYAITPEVPPNRARHYQAHHAAGVTRGEGILARLQAYRLAGPSTGTRTLDLGCGTAGLVAAAMAQGGEVWGVDIAFRWLVVARRRLDDLGLPSQNLVCACADHLPFPDGRFDTIIAENLLEHARAPAAVLTEAGRVRRRPGAFMARTVNRFALAPEPHVGVWGVGFLPRGWMDAYVRWRRGLPYQHIQLQSYFDLARLIARSGQSDLRIARPWLSAADYQHHPAHLQRLFRLYGDLGARVPPLRPLLTLFGPYLDLVSRPAAG